MPAKSVHIQLRVTPALRDKLKAQATKRDMKVSQLIWRALAKSEPSLAKDIIEGN